MKKLNYLLLGASALLLASCTQEEIINGNEGMKTKAVFSVKLPDNFKTRAIADGLQANVLYLAVYDESTGGLEINPAEPLKIGENGVNVELDLVAGKSYTITFFAGNSSAVSTEATVESEGGEPVYLLNQSTGTLAVNYTNMTSEGNAADQYDCFYANYTTGPIGSAGIQKDVTLTRPVAQINWGTNDLASVAETFGEDGKYIQTKLVANLPTTMSLVSGTVTPAGNNEVVLPPFVLPTVSEDPSETGYSYLAYQYVLASSTPESINLTLEVANAGNPGAAEYQVVSVPVEQVSVQANYQTNVYGSLLTGKTPTTVTDEEWDPNLQYLKWDGETRTTPTIDTSNKTVTINTPDELAGLADYVNASNNLSGYTVSLEEDFDMGGYEFPMIGDAYRNALKSVSGNTFQGVFDGQGHKIKNLKVTGGTNRILLGQVTRAASAGFMSGIGGTGTEFRNVNFINVEIDGTTNSNEQAAVIGLVTDGATVSNVTVSGIVYSTEGAGGIVGRIIGTGNIEDCTNYADISVTSKNAGGIVGVAYEAKSPGMNINNCTNYGTVTGGTQVIGGIVGLNAANVSGCINNGQVGNNLTTQYAGGIAAYQNSCGSITGCTNNGMVQANSLVGGILGWAGGITYTLKSVIVITDNTNNGSLLANGAVAGIMTQNSATVNLFRNTNNAPSITSNNGQAAGIGTNGMKSGASNGGNGYINIEENTNTTPAADIIGKKTSETYLGTYAENGNPVDFN